MLELLLYCHMAARMRYPHHFDAVAVCLKAAKTQCRAVLARAAFGRNQRASGFDPCIEPQLIAALDRLDAYVTSVA